MLIISVHPGTTTVSDQDTPTGSRCNRVGGAVEKARLYGLNRAYSYRVNLSIEHAKKEDVVMGAAFAILRSSIFMSVFFVALRVIGISWRQTILIMIITAALMVFGIFWRFTAGAIGLVFLWAIAISLSVAPDYPTLTAAVSVSQDAVSKVIQDNFPKVKEDISEMVKDNLPKVKDQVSDVVKKDIPAIQDNLPKVKEEISGMVKDNLPKVKDEVSDVLKKKVPVTDKSISAGMEKPGSIEAQFQAIDLLAKSGAIKQEDADLIKGNLSEKSSVKTADSATPSK